MKLYFSPGACSLSPHIALREAGLDVQLVYVDIKSHKLADGSDYFAINPKGYVPALLLDSGDLLTEGPAIVQYIADLKPESHLAPPNGTLARYHLQEWLNFISTEIHKPYGPLFKKDAPEDQKTAARDKINKRFNYIEQKLGENQFLLGDDFGVADCYLYVMLIWTKHTGLDLSPYPKLSAYRERIAARPSVRVAIEAEKALKPRI